MAKLSTPHGALRYEVIDITPPWVEAPETILFCHGVGTNADIWSGWLPHLVGRWRIVRFDTRGFGRSERPGDGFEWSLDSLADDILRIAAHTRTPRFHLVGESMGGTFALHLAARGAPEVASVTVCSTSHKGASIEHVREWRAFVTEHGMSAWSEQMMARRFAPGAIPDAVWTWFDRVQEQTDAEVLLAAADMLIGADISPALPAIGVPCLILAPDSSPFVPVSVAAELFGLVPDSRLRTFAGARHGLACSHGAECAKELGRFLEAVAA